MAEQQPQPQQQQPAQSKMIVDSRSRDIRRRIDVIQKKIADLQELGVPCAFTYTSARNTGSIFTVGDGRVTDVIERHKNEIIKNLMDSETSDGSYSTNEIHMILPPLPAPLEDLNRTSLQTLITGILKDLGLRWTDPRPNWWPPDIPFVAPRSTPENFTGSWTLALKRVLESVYSYFSYDVNTYVATKLETWTRSPTATEAAATLNESSDASHAGGDSPAEVRGNGRFPFGSTSSSDESTATRSSSSQGASCDSPAFDESKLDSNSSQRKPPSKSISSFTVENILMGRQRSLSSSDSPISTNTAGSFMTPPPSNNIASSIATMNSHSSVVGTNWVSHPPVKYTKFTMLSPTSMADETQKKKKTDSVVELQWRDHGNRGESVQTHPSSSDHGNDLKRTPSSLRGSMVDLSTTFSVSQKPKSFSRSSSSGTPSSFFHKGGVVSDPQPSAFQTHNLYQAAAKLSTLPLLQAVPSATDVKSAVLHQTFPASGQQVVLLIPSNSTSIAAAGSVPTLFYTNPVLSLPQSTLSPSPAVSTTPRFVAGSPSTLSSSGSSTSSLSQTHEERVSVSTPHHQRHSVIDESAPSPHDQSEAYRPIAPKTTAAAMNADLASRDHHRESKNSSDKMKLYLKRTIPKPPKLRFHMTTVMKQPTGNTVMTSLTAQSPQAISSETAAGSDRGPLSMTAVSQSEHVIRPEFAAESKITRSPNIYSNEGGGQRQRGVVQTKQEPYSSGSSPSSTQGSPKHGVLNSVPANGGFINSTGKNGAVSKAQTAVLKDSGFHLQVVKQQGGGGARDAPAQQNSSDQEHSAAELDMEKTSRQNGRQQSGPGRGRGRTTRSYTRRKRELTFHLYEDPSTAFRAKRQCKDNREPQH